MEFKDYYKVLGVERTADAKAISRAFKRLARQHHPDVNKAAGAEERFKEINEAYQVLGDPQKRARYDQMYEAYQRGGPNWQDLFGGAGGWPQGPGGYTVTMEGDVEDLLGGFSDFFRQFFGGDVIGGARGRSRRSRTAPVGVEELLRRSGARTAAPEAMLEVSLEEAFRGAQKPLSLRVDGQTRRLDVTIPKGIRSGQKIRLPGALDGRDLYLTVQVQPHPQFERLGDDVLVELPVALTEALLGAEVEVPTLEGSVTMTIPKETQTGRTFRLRGLGMPRAGGERGDQLVRIRVVLPTDLTADERRFFEEMGRRRANPRAGRER